MPRLSTEFTGCSRPTNFNKEPNSETLPTRKQEGNWGGAREALTSAAPGDGGVGPRDSFPLKMSGRLRPRATSCGHRAWNVGPEGLTFSWKGRWPQGRALS